MKHRIVFDTSILIPALLKSHPNHSACLSWLARGYQGKFDWAVPTHCLAEIFAGITAIPSSPRISPAYAAQAVDDLISKAEIINLTLSDYKAALARCALGNLSSGIIYDALIVEAAERFRADTLLTYNLKDFARLLGARSSILKSP